MTNHELVSQPIAAVIAAGIAALIALIVSILTKESKTSEFRQQWIDAVRNDLAEFMSAVGGVVQHKRLSIHSPSENPEDRFFKHYPMAEAAATRATRLVLRLNPDEHREIICLIDRLLEAYSMTEPEYAKLTTKLTLQSQQMLKAEWSVVKRGEPAFRYTKLGALAIVGAALAFIVWQAWRALPSSP